ncbi:MAG: hypothetical protein PHC94_11455 [Methylobacter sp.]|nr:hypothetical protein [Methylobacter sp.]
MSDQDKERLKVHFSKYIVTRANGVLKSKNSLTSSGEWVIRGDDGKFDFSSNDIKNAFRSASKKMKSA